jgi:signal transduction histidine kinase
MSSKAAIRPAGAAGGATQAAAPERRGRPLWQYFTLALVLAVVPLALVATGLLLAQAQQERVKLERALASTAKTLSLAVDREVRSYAVLLRTLAESESLYESDLARFYVIAARVARENNAAFVSLFSADGHQLLNTARPYGLPLPQPFFGSQNPAAPAGQPPVGDIHALQRVLSTGQPGNSNLYRSLATGQLLITVDVAVRRDGKVVYALNIAFEPSALQVLLDQPTGALDTLGVIIDANDFILARWDGRLDTIGKPAARDYQAARAESPNFVTSGVSLEGRPVIFAAYTSPLTGWTSVASIGGEHVDAQVRRIWIVGALMTLTGMIVGVALAYYLGRRINASLQSLVDVASGQNVPVQDAIDAMEITALREALLRARTTEREAAADRERSAAARARQLELEQASTQKDRFIATLSHELRNPLGVIRNTIALLQHGGSTEKAVGILERQTNHLIRLIDDLLDLSRLARDKIRLENETLDLRSVIAESIELVQARLDRRTQTLSIEQPDHPLQILGDRVRLRQVIANLIDNASKYSPEASLITVRLAVAGGFARLVVSDEGPGIDAGHLETIFEPFVQMPDPRLQQTEGLGLGLPLARQLVELHGGRLEVRNRATGTGCEAEIELPLAG